MRSLCTLLLLSLGLATSSAAAVWPPGGRLVCEWWQFGMLNAECLDAPDGRFYVVAPVSASNGGWWGAVLIDPAAADPVQWGVYNVGDGLGSTVGSTDAATAPSGTLLFTHPRYTRGFQTTIAMDGTALLWEHELYQSSQIIATTVAPGLGDDFYVAFGSELRRFAPSGALDPAWPLTGTPPRGPRLGLSIGQTHLLPDGSGGVIAYTPDAVSPSGPRAYRVDPTGVPHAGWPAAGLLLSDLPDSKGAETWVDYAPLAPLVRSGPAHYIALWAGQIGQEVTSPRYLRLQRFSEDGALDPTWPTGGLEIAARDTNESPKLIEDGTGGAYVLWYRNGMPVGTHVLASGAIAGQSGVSLLPAPSGFSRPRIHYDFGQVEVLRNMIADCTPDGRLMFAWDDTSQAGVPAFRVRWLLPDLTPDPSEPASGRLVLKSQAGASIRTLRMLRSDGAGGAYVGWEVLPNLNHVDLWMTRVLPSALVDVPRASNGPSALTLTAPRPNPARDATLIELALAADAPAKVELLDVAGRVLRTRTVEGAGRHSLAFTGLRDLPPGLYFVRATTNGESQRTRVVLTR